MTFVSLVRRIESMLSYGLTLPEIREKIIGDTTEEMFFFAYMAAHVVPDLTPSPEIRGTIQDPGAVIHTNTISGSIEGK